MDILTKKNIMIIGNGFDLAHGIKSSYIDFITNYEGGSLHFKYLKATCQDLSWVDVETEIEYLHKMCATIMEDRSLIMSKVPEYSYLINKKRITNSYPLSKYIDEIMDFLVGIFIENKCKEAHSGDSALLKESEYIGYDEYISADFSVLEEELSNYLFKETEDFGLYEKKPYFEKMLENSKIIFTYNYTMTVEEIYGVETYSEGLNIEKVKHMHGYVSNCIILGTPYNLDNKRFLHLSKNLRVIEENTFLSERELQTLNMEVTSNEFEKRRVQGMNEAQLYTGEYITPTLLEIPNLIIAGLSLGESDWYTLRKLVNATEYPMIYILYHSPNSKREIIKNLSLMLEFEEMNSLFSKNKCKLVSYDELNSMG